MNRKIVMCLAAVLLPVILILPGCGGGDSPQVPQPAAGEKKIKVSTTIYPLSDFTQKIGGDRVEVIKILPPGADPHHWEPTPGDLISIGRSDVFIYSGAGLELWAESVLKNTDRKKTAVVDCSKGVKLLPGNPGSRHQQDEEPHAGGADPHIWLDPVNAGIMVDNILAGLVAADPAGKDYYSARAGEFKTRLAELDALYKETLARAKLRQFVVSHAAFGYLAGRYGLEQVPVRGLTAEAEPGPARMAEIVKQVRENRIKYIFVEPLVNAGVSQAIARETGAGILTLNPIVALTENEINEGKDYLSIMRENLDNLAIACEAR